MAPGRPRFLRKPWIRRAPVLTRVAIAGVLALAAGPAGRAQEHLYKWTDERGVIHFSNSSLPRRYAGKVEVRTPLPTHVAPTRTWGGAGIPLVSENRKKFVRVRLEGSRSARQVMMLVDTGAQMTLIDEQLAEELGAEFLEEAGIVSVAGVVPGWMGRLRRLQLGDTEVQDWTVMVGPIPGLALLGLDVLDRLRLSVGIDRLEKK